MGACWGAANAENGEAGQGCTDSPRAASTCRSFILFLSGERNVPKCEGYCESLPHPARHAVRGQVTPLCDLLADWAVVHGTDRGSPGGERSSISALHAR